MDNQEPRVTEQAAMNDLRALISDDGYAMSFQSMGQYRTALLKAIALTRQAAPEAPTGYKLVPLEPITGPNYTAGLWSRRNWEAALEDQAPATQQAGAGYCADCNSWGGEHKDGCKRRPERFTPAATTASASGWQARRYCKGDASWSDWADVSEEEFKRRRGDVDFQVRRAPAPKEAAPLPRWIDDLKGKDSTIDSLIEYIIAQQGAAQASASTDYDCYNCGGKESAHHEGCPAIRAAQAAHAGAVPDEQEKVAPPFAAPAQLDASDLVAQPRLYARLMEMSEIIRAGSRWDGNEQVFADKSESDVAMLDDILGDALRLAAQPEKS